jgi:uncharacterized protein (TIGR02145 family)
VYFLHRIFQRKIQAIELALTLKLEEQLNTPYSPRLFYLGLVFLNIRLVAWQILSDFYKFCIILFADPGNSFNLFFRQRELRSCPYSYDSYKKIQTKVRVFSATGATAIVVVAVATSLITNFLFGGKLPTWAATYGWQQTDWGGGLSALLANHDSNKTGWGAYAAIDDGVTASSTGVWLTSTSTAWTQDTETDFGAGTLDKSIISGSGTAALMKNDRVSAANLLGAYHFNNNGNDSSGNNQTLTTVNAAPINERITNGGFESGLSGWTTSGAVSTTGSGGSPCGTFKALINGVATVYQTNVIVSNNSSLTYRYYTGVAAGQVLVDDVLVRSIPNSAGVWTVDTVGISPGTHKISFKNTNAGYLMYLDCISLQEQPPIFSDSGKFFQALNTVSAQTASVAASVALGANSTIAGWINAGAGGSGSYKVITQSNAGNDQLVVRKSDNHLGIIASGIFRDSNSTFGSGWHHLAAAASGGSTQFYIDGTSAGSVGYSIASDIKYVANASDGNSPLGGLDDLLVYGRTLSANEIAVLGSAAVASEFNPASPYYFTPGTYVSPIHDTIGNTGFSSISWLETLNGGTTKLRVRTSNDPNMAGAHAWDDACNISNNADISNIAACTHDGDRYAQYQITLNAKSDLLQAPTVDKVTINYDRVPPTTTAKTQDSQGDFETSGYNNSSTITAQSPGSVELIRNFQCGTSFVDPRDGYAYSTVLIGTQCWFAENLRTTKRPDGTNLVEGAGMYSNPAGYDSPWGRLYDWNTAMNGVAAAASIGAKIQGICPVGWHIPSDYNANAADDFQKLSNYLGGDTVAGGKMKVNSSLPYWTVGGSNTSGFSGVGAGSWTGGFGGRGDLAFFWTSSQAAFYRTLYGGTTDNYLRRGDYYESHAATDGFSVRCVKDQLDPNPTSGTFTSAILNVGASGAWDKIDWSEDNSVLASTSVSIRVRSCNDVACVGELAISSCPALTRADKNVADLVSVSKGCVRNGDQYIQYQADLSTIDPTKTPQLQSVSLKYLNWNPTSRILTSSAYDTTSNANLLGQLRWTEALFANTELKFQIRTAPDNLATPGTPGSWTEWLGPAGAASYYTDPNGGEAINAINGDGVDDQWIQYKLFLESSGPASPKLSSANLVYVVNSVPEFDPIYGTNGVSVSQITTSTDPNFGKVLISYDVRDPDTASQTVSPSFEYSTDNGVNWTAINAIRLGAGDAQPQAVATSSFTLHTAVWDTEHDSSLGAVEISNAKIRVTINDGEGAKNIAKATSSAFLLDTKAPTLGVHPVVMQADVGENQSAIVTLAATDLTAVYMKVGKDPELDDVADWSAYNANTSISLAGANPSTIYAKFKDAYGNESVASAVTTPTTPQSFMIQDTSNIKDGLTDYRLFIAWKKVNDSQPSAAFSSYEVFRSTDNGSTFQIYNTIASSSINYFTDNAALSEAPTYYYVITKDANGNTSFRSPIVKAQADGIQNFGEGGGGAVPGGSDMPPTIDPVSIATSSIYTTQTTIRWNTNLPSDSLVYYQTTPGCDFSSAISAGSATMRSEPSTLGAHEVTLAGLTPATTYYFQVRSAGATGLTASSTCEGDGYAFTTEAGPAIVPDSVTRANVGNTTIDIGWTTDQAADSYVVFSTSSDMIGSVELGSSNAVTDHAVTLFGLTPNTTYYFYVKSSNARDDNAGSYYAFTTTRDLTPPTISGLSASPADTSVVVQFATAKPATTTVTVTNHAVPAESYTTAIDTLDTAHRFDFAGLAAATLYDVSATARDANGNTDTKATSFTTLAAPDTAAPVITFDPLVDVVTSQAGAVITWTTGEDATGYVEYATTSATSTFNLAYKQVGRSDLASNHTVTLEGLAPKTIYYFRLRSADASGNTAIDPADDTFHSFQTVLQALTLSNVATSTVTDSSAVVTWSTNHAADTKIIYGTSTGDYALEQINPTPTQEHTIILNSLASSTAYYFRAVSNDTLGQTATSSEFSFTTAAAPIDPNDYQSKIDQINDLLAQLAAASSTNLDLISQLQDQVAALQDQVSQLNASTTAMETRISDLLSQIATLQDQLVDADPALAASLTQQLAELQSRLAEAQKKGGGGVLIIDNTKPTDKTAPKISNIQTADIKSDAAQVSWTTDDPASSFIRYGTTTAYGEFSGYSDLFTSHYFQLKNLEASSTYHYRIESADASGNLATSQDQSFITPSLEAQLQTEGKTPEEIQKIIEDVQQPEESKTNILLAAAQKAMEIISQVANQVSLGTLETTLLSQFDTIEKLAGAIPGPILGGEPMVVTGATTATVSWNTDKQANSLVAYAPEGVYIKAEGDNGYLQVVGDANSLTTKHAVRLAGLKPNATYHYQLRSKAQLGPEAKSRDFTFKTKEEGLEVLTHGTEVKDPSNAIFRWSTNLEADTKLAYTPYRSGKLAIEEKREAESKVLTTMHEMEAKDLESGVVYQISMQSKDQKGRLAEEVIEQFSTSKDDLPPQISSVQTESALSQGKQLKVQTIVSWQTNEPTIGQVQYIKGVVTDDKEFPDKTPIETTYSRKHVAVVTKFDSGQVYTFRITATDSSGNLTTSKIYTILTPKQKESVFQLILKNFEDIFGWVGKVGN